MPILRPLALALVVCLQFPPPAVDVPKRDAPGWLAPYREPVSRLIGEAVASDAAWQRLAYLGDTFGPRLAPRRPRGRIKWESKKLSETGSRMHTEAVSPAACARESFE